MVVMMAQEEMLLPSGSLHADQSPAKAKGSPVRKTMRMGLSWEAVTDSLCERS